LTAQGTAYSVTTECSTVTLTVDGSSRAEKASSDSRNCRIDDIVERAEVAAQFRGDAPDYCDVFADEFACGFDEGRHGSAGRDDVQYSARRAPMRQSGEQRGFLDAEPRREFDGVGEQTEMRSEQRIVDQLHLLAGSQRADMQDRVSVAAQYRADSGHRVP